MSGHPARRSPFLFGLALTALLAVLQALDALVEILDWPVGLKVATTFVPAIVGGCLEGRRSLVERRAAADSERVGLRALVELWPPPRLADADPVLLGVFASDVSGQRIGPYVARDEDDAARRELRRTRYPALIIEGPSKAGKSRTAYETARHVLGDHAVLVPRDGSAARQLIDRRHDLERVTGRRLVLWLDDLERFLSPGGLDAPLLEQWRSDAADVAVVATLRSAERQRLLAGPPSRSGAARASLDGFESVGLPRELRQGERQRAALLYPDQQFEAGLGEHFSAARLLLARYEAAADEAPLGLALARAAVDWRRVRLGHRPIPEDVLRRLFPIYLAEVRPEVEAGAAAFVASLAWAREPVAAVASVVRTVTGPDGRAGLVVFDYLVAAEEAEVPSGLAAGRAVPADAWAVLLDAIVPSEGIALGWSALDAGQDAIAERALTLGERTSHPLLAPTAAMTLSILAEKRDDLEASERALRRALNAPTPSQRAAARGALGLLLRRRTRLAEAETLLREVLAEPSADAVMVDMCHVGLADLLVELDQQEQSTARRDEAIEHYRLGAQSPEPRLRGHSQLHLGPILYSTGDRAGARAVLRSLLASDNLFAPAAGIPLAQLEIERGDVDAAVAALLSALPRAAAPARGDIAIRLALAATAHDDLPLAARAREEAHAYAHGEQRAQAAAVDVITKVVAQTPPDQRAGLARLAGRDALPEALASAMRGVATGWRNQGRRDDADAADALAAHLADPTDATPQP